MNIEYEARNYDSSVCGLCGAIIYDTDKHTIFHSELKEAFEAWGRFLNNG